MLESKKYVNLDLVIYFFGCKDTIFPFARKKFGKQFIGTAFQKERPLFRGAFPFNQFY